MMQLLKSNPKLWDTFTRKEEYNPIIRDKDYGFRSYLSQNRRIFEPVVSNFLFENGYTITYPNNKDFAVCLTHDIDNFSYSGLNLPLQSAKKLIKGNLKQSFNIWTSKIDIKKSPLWNLSDIMELEKKYDAKSTFFILALTKGEMDYSYRLNDIKDELIRINQSGWEIALHGGHSAYNNFEQMRIEKQRLENVIDQKVNGYRNHFLKFIIPETWEYLQKCGFKYDTTVGFYDCTGFRNGMCHPYIPYNLTLDKPLKISEIPLTIEDCTLWETMNLDLVQSWKLLKLLLDRVKKVRGAVSVSWHNQSFIDESKKELYNKLLSYCQEQNAWMTSGFEIWKWYEDNDFFF